MGSDCAALLLCDHHVSLAGVGARSHKITSDLEIGVDTVSEALYAIGNGRVFRGCCQSVHGNIANESDEACFCRNKQCGLSETNGNDHVPHLLHSLRWTRTFLKSQETQGQRN